MTIEELKGKRKKYIDEGTQGRIYDIGDNTCFKKFFNPCVDPNGILSAIKNLKLSNFCEIKDIIESEGYILGYTMPIYHHDPKLDILGLPKDYIIDSYHGMYDGVIKISGLNIIMRQLAYYNTIITRDGIIACDYDRYEQGTDEKITRLHNLAYLNSLFNEMFMEQVLFKHSQYNPLETDRNINALFNARTTPETLEDSLDGYSTPIEYIRGYHA